MDVAVRYLHTLSIFFAYCIGAALGRKLYKWIFPALLFAVPLKAQIWLGDTAWVHENRQSRGYFYVDTSEAIGWYRYDKKRQWIEEIKTSLLYWDTWQATANCQGVPTSYADFRKYRFFAINRESFGGVGPNQIGYYGYHLSDSMAIYLARPKMNDRGVLMHEMSHAFQYLRGWKVNHSFRFFGPFFCGLNYVTYKTADQEERR